MYIFSFSIFESVSIVPEPEKIEPLGLSIYQVLLKSFVCINPFLFCSFTANFKDVKNNEILLLSLKFKSVPKQLSLIRR